MPRAVRALVVGLAALALLVAGMVGLAALVRGSDVAPPGPEEERCVATANDASVVLDLEQAHYASIIAGMSVRRGLAPRAATIALATVYQETGIRNLDYGDRDSVGLFQQRPSQGWGTEEQLMDPHYATRKFYDALVRVPGWETGDITEVAQRVQRSGYPDAYRDHEADARVLASTLTGHSRGGLTCLDRSETAGQPDELRAALRDTFGRVPTSADAAVLTLRAEDRDTAWAWAHFAVANAGRYGVAAVRVGDRQWQGSADELASWTRAAEGLRANRVQVTLR
ncbi:MAG: hypothetical protein ACLGIF_03750 [Actinomycetes bacterium]